MGDSILCGSDWGVGLFVEGPWHAWTFGAMTAGEVSDMRAALASIYSVTV